MDVRRQLDRDSDVIQITILDREVTSVPEASNHADFSGDDATDHLSFSSACEDESLEGNYVETDIYTPKMRSNSKNLEIHTVLADEAIRRNKTKESNLVAESSETEKSPANSSKSFEDDACIDTRKAYTHDRCLTELIRSVKPDYHHSEDSNSSDDNRGRHENRYHARRLRDDRKHDDRMYHERCNNHLYNNRSHKDFNLKTHHEIDYIIPRRTDDKRKPGEHRYHARHNNGFFSMCDERHSTFRRRLHAFDPYNEENISYSKLEVPLDYYGERFRGYEDWDTERFGANTNQISFRSLEEDKCYDEQRRYIEDNTMLAEDWCHDEKGPKKGENLYFRNKGEIDEFDLESGYYDDTHVENFSSFTYNDRKRDDAEYTRWEFRGPGRNKRGCSLFSELDNPLLKSDHEQSFASRFSEESHINNSRWRGNMMPKRSFYRSHGSHGGKYFEPFDRECCIIDIDGGVDMRRRRCSWQSKIQWEDEIMSTHQDAKFYAHRNSFPFEKVSRRKRFVSEPDPDHVEELIGDPYIVDSQLVYGSGYVTELTEAQRPNGCRYHKQKNEVCSGYKCIKTYGRSLERLSLSSRNSHLLVGEVKSSEKHEWADFNTCLNEKVARADETKAIDEDLDIEEGQILTKEVNVGPMIDKTRAHANSLGNQSRSDNTRILEAMAKMEKRRARFNEPITIARKGSDSLAVVDSVQETASKRPARKRRWGGS